MGIFDPRTFFTRETGAEESSSWAVRETLGNSPSSFPPILQCTYANNTFEGKNYYYSEALK